MFREAVERQAEVTDVYKGMTDRERERDMT